MHDFVKQLVVALTVRLAADAMASVIRWAIARRKRLLAGCP